jgi:hypothetical protein
LIREESISVEEGFSLPRKGNPPSTSSGQGKVSSARMLATPSSCPWLRRRPPLWGEGIASSIREGTAQSPLHPGFQNLFQRKIFLTIQENYISYGYIIKFP